LTHSWLDDFLSVNQVNLLPDCNFSLGAGRLSFKTVVGVEVVAVVVVIVEVVVVVVEVVVVVVEVVVVVVFSCLEQKLYFELTVDMAKNAMKISFILCVDCLLVFEQKLYFELVKLRRYFRFG